MMVPKTVHEFAHLHVVIEEREFFDFFATV